jgi:uncharacterized NAD(P)/FAD-binding protein YdhS
MRAMSDGIIIALIGGGFSVLVALLELMRRQNNRDHGTNSAKLDYLAELFRDHLKGHK